MGKNIYVQRIENMEYIEQRPRTEATNRGIENIKTFMLLSRTEATKTWNTSKNRYQRGSENIPATRGGRKACRNRRRQLGTPETTAYTPETTPWRTGDETHAATNPNLNN
ncbi:uncharacterized protein G2W53_040286 [Senna tora]|uniref:Uncharacterized protein n=1 Tax=Senna tora TaxID=362788 RepID=A0A834SSH4_9FABA|nr:uncharacterized protein G2W53_040286 [Senna tora]